MIHMFMNKSNIPFFSVTDEYCFYDNRIDYKSYNRQINSVTRKQRTIIADYPRRIDKGWGANPLFLVFGWKAQVKRCKPFQKPRRSVFRCWENPPGQSAGSGNFQLLFCSRKIAENSVRFSCESLRKYVDPADWNLKRTVLWDSSKMFFQFWMLKIINDYLRKCLEVLFFLLFRNLLT